jgi:signal transduction histidine kinase
VASSPARVVATVVGLALLVGAIGASWELARFGFSSEATAARLEREVQRRFLAQARQVEGLAKRIAADPGITEALAVRDRAAQVFARLTALTRPSAASPVSATIYGPAGPAGAYRIVAWSDGPADNLTQTPDRLTGPPALFVAPGTAGLSLVFVQPIEAGGRRIGIVAAEAVLSPGRTVGSSAPGSLRTSYGPVSVVQLFGAAGDHGPAPGRFAITAENNQPLLEVQFSPAQLDAQRAAFRRWAFAIAMLPLVAGLLLATGPLVSRRSRARGARAWFRWSFAAAGVLAVAVIGLFGIASLVGLSAGWWRLLTSLAALALVAIFPVSAWWRRWAQRVPQRAPVRFLLEQLAAGTVFAAAVLLVVRVLRDRITPASLERWQFPLLPVDPPALRDLSSLLITQIAVFWAAGTTVAILASRWKLTWRHAIGWAALALWIAPTIAVVAAPAVAPPAERAAAMAAVGLTALFGLFSFTVRHVYRHTTQAMRLILVFAALALPVIVAYPLGAASADRAIRALIENEYAPATARSQQPDSLGDVLERAKREIDQIPNLLDLLASRPSGPTVQSQTAFHVWNQTTLSRDRVTSEIELYGPDPGRALVSRFALNMPQFQSVIQTGTPSWLGTSCSWEAFAEVDRFGSEERKMLHAERGICDAAGNFAGAVVIHIMPDYRALPFVSSANPYYEVLSGPDALPPASRIANLQVVVYGWSLRTLFTSGRVAWPISDEILARLTRSRDPFWTSLTAGGERYEVHIRNDRTSIYALGYPPPTLFAHLSRLSEVTVVVAALFVLMLVGAAVYAPFARRQHAPLRLLYEEIRTSFYRKLFLFFVLAAVAPVLLFATAFGTYMTGKFLDDVEAEASQVVRVAQRVFEELAAIEQQPVQSQLALTDDVMVWIRQVIDQDVNLYEGPELVATSQRDLFDSGLLPTRTPAAVYREVAINRLPVVVADDRIGAFEYLVAAAPVSARGRDTTAQPSETRVLSVPLASRQREIEQQIDELNRGVLVGGVVVVLFAAALGASVAGRVSDPVARLTRATRQIAAGRLDVRLVADTADELGRLVDDFSSMTRTLLAQRDELARTNQLKAWAEMARQVAHEIKNPLTPIQLAAEHLQRVHEDQQRPLGPVFDQCLSTILRQVRLLRQIASEFSSFAGQVQPRFAAVSVPELIDAVVSPYRVGLSDRIDVVVTVPPDLPAIGVDRTLVARALTNLIENAVQAMPSGGRLAVSAASAGRHVVIEVDDTGVGMDGEAVRRAFEPYFSTKTAGSGLGLANAKRNIELCGGTIEIKSAPGAGANITVRLPVAARDDAPESESAPSR